MGKFLTLAQYSVPITKLTIHRWKHCLSGYCCATFSSSFSICIETWTLQCKIQWLQWNNSQMSMMVHQYRHEHEHDGVSVCSCMLSVWVYQYVEYVEYIESVLRVCWENIESILCWEYVECVETGVTVGGRVTFLCLGPLSSAAQSHSTRPRDYPIHLQCQPFMLFVFFVPPRHCLLHWANKVYFIICRKDGVAPLPYSQHSTSLEQCSFFTILHQSSTICLYPHVISSSIPCITEH